MVVISWFHAIRIKLKKVEEGSQWNIAVFNLTRLSLQNSFMYANTNKCWCFLYTNIKYTRRSSHTGAQASSPSSNNCTELHHSLNQSPMDGHQSFQSFAISHQATVYDLEFKHIWSNSDKHDALLLLDILPFSTCGAHSQPVSPVWVQDRLLDLYSSGLSQSQSIFLSLTMNDAEHLFTCFKLI